MVLGSASSGEKTGAGLSEREHTGPGGTVTHLSSHHCGIAQSFPLVLALAGTSLAARRTYTGLHLLTLRHMRWEWGSEGLPSSPRVPWMSSGPAPPSLRVPCATHPALPHGRVANPGDGALCGLVCVPHHRAEPPPQHLAPAFFELLSIQHSGTCRADCLSATQGTDKQG